MTKIKPRPKSPNKSVRITPETYQAILEIAATLQVSEGQAISNTDAMERAALFYLEHLKNQK